MTKNATTTQPKVYTLADAVKLTNANVSAQQLLNAIMLQDNGADLIAQACTEARAKSSSWSEAVIRAQLARVPVAAGASHWGIRWDKDAKSFRVAPSAARRARTPKTAEEAMKKLCDDLGVALFLKIADKVAKEAIAAASAKGTSAAA